MKEKFQKIYEFVARKGQAPVALFAVLKMDDLVNKWSFIFSLEGEQTSESKNEVFKSLLEEVNKELSADELLQIARVVVLDSNDHLADSLLKFKSGEQISNAHVNGNFVHEGYIIKAQDASAQVEKSVPVVLNESEPKSNN